MNANGCVLDANVVAKWFLEEENSTQARQIEALFQPLLVPDLLIIEVANVFLTKVRAGTMTAVDAVAGLSLVSTKVVSVDTSPLIRGAFELATSYDVSIYDGLYVALAIQQDCVLLTADNRLVKAVEPDLPGRLMRLADASA